MAKGTIIRTIYLYGVALICLVISVIAAIGLVNLGLNRLVLHTADDLYYSPEMCATPTYNGKENVKPSPEEIKKCEQDQQLQQTKVNDNNFKRELASFTSMLLIALPIWIFHWKLIQRDQRALAAALPAKNGKAKTPAKK